jgi:hypothetical protein
MNGRGERHAARGAGRPAIRAGATPKRVRFARAASVVSRMAAVVVAVGGSLSACDVIFPPPEDRSPRIDIYASHYEYRYNRYETVRALRLALDASEEDIARLIVQECAGTDRLPAMLDMLRSRGNYDIAVIIVPKDCSTD